MMKFRAIVMCDQQYAIGKNGDQPIHLKQDLQRFKDTTSNQIVICGRKTLETFPNKKPLPNRINLILSSQNTIENVNEPNKIIHSKQDAIDECTRIIHELKKKPIISRPNDINIVNIIGGESIYKLFSDEIDEVWLTKVYINFENPDKFFPINLLSAKYESVYSHYEYDRTSNGWLYPTEFIIYRKRK